MADLSAGRPVVLGSTAADLTAGALPAPTTIAATTTYVENFEPEAMGSGRAGRGLVMARALLAADILAMSFALVLALGVAHAIGADEAPAGALITALPFVVLGARIRGLYRQDEQRPEYSTLDELGAVFQLATVATWLACVFAWLVTGSVSVAPAVALWAGSATLLVLARGSARAAVSRHPAYVQNTVIVGAGEVGQLVARKLLQHEEFGVRVVGFVDADPRELRTGVENVPVIGAPTEIESLVEAHGIHRVVIAFSNDRHEVLVPLIRSLRDLNVQIDFVPRLFEAFGPVSSVHTIEGLPLVSLPPVRRSRLARRTKRIIDIVLGCVIIVLSLPLVAWIAWRIKRDSPGPVFFRQTRLGENQRPFTMLKFRTMKVDTDAAPHREYIRGIMDVAASPAANSLYKLDRSDDVTRVGAWLRRTSLDELPQLINVIRGEMSLVGPRPCIAYETELFEPHHFDRFLVPAGMTGLWQVAARARSTFKEALDLDAAYARNWSLGLDATLVVRTPLALLRDKATT